MKGDGMLLLMGKNEEKRDVKRLYVMNEWWIAKESFKKTVKNFLSFFLFCRWESE